MHPLPQEKIHFIPEQKSITRRGVFGEMRGKIISVEILCSHSSVSQRGIKIGAFEIKDHPQNGCVPCEVKNDLPTNDICNRLS